MTFLMTFFNDFITYVTKVAKHKPFYTDFCEINK